MRLGATYKGVNPLVPLSVLTFFAFLFFRSKTKSEYSVYCAYLFILAYYLPTTYALFKWGVDLPLGLLSYVLIIILAGILADSKFAFETVIFISLTVLILTIFQITGVTHPDIAWKAKTLTLPNVLTIVVIFYIVAIVLWLSNREIERSLKRARKSEAELKEERDTLEVRVKERTKELEKSQMEKMNQAARFIEFGKISSGLFHDLINHITFLFFDIEKAAEAGEEKMSETREYLKQANENKSVLAEYIEDAKKQFQNQKINALFSVKKEMFSVTKILGYKLKTEKVSVNLRSDFDILTYGNAVRFNHVITNIILNALEAYEASGEEGKEINIKLDKLGGGAVISIEDRAGGIPEEIRNKIFDPFFTTKGPQKGTGIGLTTAKNTMEEDFGGTIKFESVWGQGTKFIIEFPIRNEPDKS
jgi:signal transduction histidine kinase